MTRIVEKKTRVLVSGNDSDIKSIDEAQSASFQSRAHDDSDVGLGGLGVGSILSYLFRAGELVAPWWSTQRDIDLRRFVKSSDHLSGTVSLLTSKVINVPVHIEPRDLSLKTHMKQADEYMRRLVEESEFGQGWPTLCSKVLDDWFQCDAGLAMEVIGDGPKDGPIVGPALGLASLDVTRCVRKKDREFPLTYLDEDGAQYKLHYTRVAYASDQPSNIVEMRGTGFCSTSRTINIAQQLVDMSLFNMEKLGSRPMRAILFTPGIPTDVVEATMQMSAEMMDNQGLRRYSKIPILGGNSTDADVRLVPLSTLPDGFDQETNTRLAMFAMALGFGVPIRWIWPAATSGATKADAMYQHIAGLGGGIGRILNVLTMILGGDPRGQRHTVGKFLPPHLKLVFDFQDDEQDRMKAEIQERRMSSVAVGLETGVYTLRVAREKALDAGDLTQAQFDAMELADGRLPSGEDVLTLFYTGDQAIKELLDLHVEDALDVSANDAVAMLSAIEEKQAEVRKLLSETSVASRKKAVKEALAALGKLREAYEEGQSAQQQADDAETEEQASGQDQPKVEGGEQGSPVVDDEESEEGEIEEEEKAFLDGVRVAWDAIKRAVKGGPGSGHHGHSGRPGKRGGSAPSGVEQMEPNTILKEIPVWIRAEKVQGALLFHHSRGKRPDGPDYIDWKREGIQRAGNIAIRVTPRDFKRPYYGTFERNPDYKIPYKPMSDWIHKEVLKAVDEFEDAASGKKKFTEKSADDTKVWSSLSDVPAHLRTMHDAPLTLGQVNHLARIGDAIERQGKVKNPWAAARAQFQKLYRIEDGRWVRRGEDDKSSLWNAIERAVDEFGEVVGNKVVVGKGTIKKALSDSREKVISGISDGASVAKRALGDHSVISRLMKSVKSLACAIKQTTGAIRYEKNISGAVQSLWNGSVSKRDFIGIMKQNVDVGLEWAWLDGARAGGITSLDELTEVEKDLLKDRIKEEKGHISGFADYVAEHNKESGFLLREFDDHIAMWANRYKDLMNHARAMALWDKKIKWVYGDTVHCTSCLKLNGKVKRASQWMEAGIRPQHPDLACHGFRCQCRFEETDEPMSKGRLPKIP